MPIALYKRHNCRNEKGHHGARDDVVPGLDVMNQISVLQRGTFDEMAAEADCGDKGDKGIAEKQSNAAGLVVIGG